MMMRGGTSKGLYFLADDLPNDPQARADLLMRLMGTPDPRQIDGLGGGAPLTSKVAVVSRNRTGDADVDYLFLQVGVDQASVTDRQNCGNLLAGVGQFALERGLIEGEDSETSVRIRMVNSDSLATARFPTPGGFVNYAGGTAIVGVPGTAAEVVLEFEDTIGSATGTLLPTGNVRDVIAGISATCVDNGMPVVVAEAASFGLTGYETHQALTEDRQLLDRIDEFRRRAGELMGLGDVGGTSIPKTTLVAPPRDGGMLSTRTFIPVEPHTSIGVFGAISVATAVRLPGAVGSTLSEGWPDGRLRINVEHPSGNVMVEVDMDGSSEPPLIRSSAVVRTARKLFDGVAYPRESAAASGDGA